jgi:hypothetical protein
MTSAIRRLLDEISWEAMHPSTATVVSVGRTLTAEVLQALDFLPRNAFSGQALREADGADLARTDAALDAEDLVFECSPRARSTPTRESARLIPQAPRARKIERSSDLAR